MAGRILVGTSSWADPGFVKEWYPPQLPAKERLPWYAQRVELVELNSSFYAVPDRGAVHGWVDATPPGFTFDVKAHRALSRHSAPVESLPPDLRELHGTPELERPLAERLVEETAPLREAGKFGTYLLQLTPAFSPRRHRLEELDALAGNTKGYLTGRSVAERFAWQYTDGELEEIAGRARTLAESAGEVHVAFNNNRGDDAPTAAQRFRALLGEEVPEPDDPQLTL